jgi:hypothetical protein
LFGSPLVVIVDPGSVSDEVKHGAACTIAWGRS